MLVPWGLAARPAQKEAPSIAARKVLAHMTPEKARELMTNPETVEEFLSTMLALTATLLQKQARLEGQNAALVAENEGLAEDAEMARKFLVSRNAVTSSQLAARFGKSARFLNEWLRRKRLLKKVNRQWLLAGRWGALPFMSTRHNLSKIVGFTS